MPDRPAAPAHDAATPADGRPSAQARGRSAPPVPAAATATPHQADLNALAQAARAVRANAHAPYSGFAVGAALRDEQGRLHVGCNVENAAYPEGLCAEAVALGALVAAGGRTVTAVAVVADSPRPITPCGGCRQKLREFAADAVPVLCGNLQGPAVHTTMGELLPYSFGPEHLGA